MSNNNRWNWEVSGFEPRKSPATEQKSSSPAPLVRRYSISTPSIVPHSELISKHTVATKLHNLKDKLKHAREDYAQLRQEAIDLQEYSNAKLDRVTRYLGVLAEKTRKLDQAALEAEAKVAPLINEKKRLYNELFSANGNIKVFCRTRPLFEDEGPSVVEFPDDFTIRINTGDDTASNPKKDYEFDRVYGPHIGQAEVFTDVQPFVQSALDGHNVSIFAYGQTGSGKTHTMEGSSHDRGLYARCFEELFDVSNSDTTSTSRFNFFVTIVELHNEQIYDLLYESESSLPKVRMGSVDSFVDVVQEKVDNPLDFSKIIKKALLSRISDETKINVSHLIITIHIYYDNLITGENLYSKLSLVDLAGSESLGLEENNGEQTTDMLHVMKSLSALGDVLASLTSKKEDVPYENSLLTKALSDSLGGSSKSLLVVNICPDVSNLSETLSSLNFSARARNTVLSLGNRDTIKKWKDVANDARKDFYEKEKEALDLKQEVVGLKQALKGANDQCVLLFNEVQKAWKVSFALQSDLKAENIMLDEKHKIEKDQNNELRNQTAQLLHQVQDQKLQLQQRDSTIESLQAKLKSIEAQVNAALQSGENNSKVSSDATGEGIESIAVTKKLEEELLKRDALIERLHEENEKLFERLTEKASSIGSQQALPAPPKNLDETHDLGSNNKERAMDVVPFSAEKKTDGTVALVKPGQDKIKSTPAGEYLTSALNDFDPEQYDAVFKFIREMEPRRVMDTMLVSRVRILYIRSLLARSPELQSIKVSPVERFLEKPTTGHSRSSSRSSSPGRSPVRYDPTLKNALMVEGQMHGFRVNLKPEKKSKLSSVVLKIRGIDQESWRQHVTGAKLREITDDAKAFATGNKALAALFVHTPAGELQRQIRSWLAMNFDFLSVSGMDAVGGATGQLELLSTAIMDGWMAGLGAAIPPITDALGQLLAEYAKRVYNSQLQHLKDIAGTLAAEAADDSSQVGKLRSALESVDHKRRKILQQMKGDNALLTLEDGGSPIRNPSSAAEDARLASLIALDGILKHIKEIMRQSSVNIMSRSKKRALITSLDDLSGQMSSLLEIDHPCAQRHIADARRVVESIVEEDDKPQGTSSVAADELLTAETDVTQWNVLQFNTGSTSPFIIKCGANSHSELVIKADDRVQEPKGGEILRVVPRPTFLENMSLEEIKEVFSKLPEALSLLALARTADGTRARYSRLYRTLAMKVPALRDLVGELEKGGGLKDVKS
uniref:kinesin-like protein KIN-14B isoform X2 n=1 Tax=Erigeron canadensis TaxID=72917 RepID=UPI001CB8BAF0|nr:kinesin-like protein KIN-14B isoform X2 [Erigeron canadensis]